MKYVILVFAVLLGDTLKIDFDKEELNSWYIVNDGVMGGLSKGKSVFTEDGTLFYGKVSLENNGGFTSFRGPFKEYELSNYSKVTIRYQSTGIRIALQMEVDKRFYYPNFKINLPNTDGWETLSFPLRQVDQYRMGNATGRSMTDDNKSEIIRIGFITNEKRAGDFSFEVDYVEFK